MIASVDVPGRVRDLEPLIARVGAVARERGSEAALVLEGGLIAFGCRSDIADRLRADYTHQADLVREHDPRIGTIVVVLFFDGSAAMSISLAPLRGCA